MNKKELAAYQRLLLKVLEIEGPLARDILTVICGFHREIDASKEVIEELAKAIPEAAQRQKAIDFAAGINALAATLLECRRMLQSNAGKVRIPVKSAPDSDRSRHPIPVEVDTPMAACS
ncbi:MAG: hypothetical protein Q9M30_02820 [Mariprofundaceae bacterium]|nr:hypothetical protein [Mariprofundaceae bacterium]